MAEDKQIKEKKELSEEELMNVNGGGYTKMWRQCPECGVVSHEYVCPGCGHQFC